MPSQGDAAIDSRKRNNRLGRDRNLKDAIGGDEPLIYIDYRRLYRHRRGTVRRILIDYAL